MCVFMCAHVVLLYMLVFVLRDKKGEINMGPRKPEKQ